MLSELKMEIYADKYERISYNKASIFQSIIMSRIDIGYAEFLHETGLHPYSQYISYENGKNYWHVFAQNEEAFNGIIKPLLDEDFTGFYMEYDECDVKIISKELISMSRSEFMDRFYFENSDKYITIRLMTPVAFKSQGNYVFMPDLTLIYQSLMNKFDAASIDESICSEELLLELVTYSQIARYKFNSTSYSISGKKLPAFMGEFTIKVNGPNQMAKLLRMLFKFGEYSGIGIKTAMGMGGLRVIERGTKDDR